MDTLNNAKEHMTELINGPWHIQMLNSSTNDRCREAYRKIKMAGWPIERTCIFFNISSTWYRNQVIRYSHIWDKEMKNKEV